MPARSKSEEVVNIGLEFHGPSALEEDHSLSCRRVIASDLNDPYHVGDFKHLQDIESTNSAITQTCRKIRALAALLDDLRKHRRSISVSQLPNEILLHIFKYCQCPVDDWDRTQWLACSQVCRRWRHLALSCPSLWTTPVLNRPELASIMVERAKSLPLNVCADGEEAWRTFLELDRDGLPVKKFHLLHPMGVDEDDPEFTTETLSEYFSTDFPHLLHFLVEYEDAPLALNLEDLIAPNLKSLSLSKAYLIGMNSSWTNLETLDIEVYSCCHSSYLEILDVLAMTPKLKRLHLMRVMMYRNMSSPTPDSTRSVSLNFLETLSLEDGISELGALLRRLCMPIVTSISVTGTVPYKSMDLHQQFSELCDIVQRLVLSLAWPSFEYSGMTLDISMRSVEIETNSADYRAGAAGHKFVAAFCPDTDYGDRLPRCAPQLISSFPLDHLSTLACKASFIADANIWQPFTRLPKLSHLDFRAHNFRSADSLKSFQSLLDAFASDLEGFPALQTLNIHNIAMWEAVPAAAPQLCRSLLAGIASYVAYRGSIHRPLSSVTLESCKFTTACFWDLPQCIHIETPYSTWPICYPASGHILIAQAPLPL